MLGSLWKMLLISVVLFGFLSCGYYTEAFNDEQSDGIGDDGDDSIGLNRKIPNYSWTTVDGGTLELYDYEGYLILLNVGAGWCAECKDETPVLEKALWRPLKDRDFVIIQTLTEDELGADADLEFARQWQEQYDITFPLCIDPDDSLEPYYKEPSLPFTILIDRDLNIIDRIHGFDRDLLTYLVEKYL